jgi:hypothetical protein
MLNKLFSLVGKSIAPAGRGVVSAVFSRGVAPSFPAAGTFNSWLYDVTYPIANGGGAVTTNAQFPNQFCDVEVKNDGSGGTYTDWSTATDVQYVAWGNEINSQSGSYDISVCSGTYSIGSYGNTYYHDGYGGYYTSGGGYYYSFGTYITSCDGYDYYSDGSGNYYTSGGGGSSCPSFGDYAYYDENIGMSAYHDGNCGYYYY